MPELGQKVSSLVPGEFLWAQTKIADIFLLTYTFLMWAGFFLVFFCEGGSFLFSYLWWSCNSRKDSRRRLRVQEEQQQRVMSDSWA